MFDIIFVSHDTWHDIQSRNDFESVQRRSKRANENKLNARRHGFTRFSTWPPHRDMNSHIRQDQNNKKGHLRHCITALFSIQYYDYWCWVDCWENCDWGSSELCTHINLCDNNAMMVAFYVLRRKSITRKNNNHKMNEKCSVGSSSESCQICIIIAHHHLPWCCDHPKNTQQITMRRYGKRLVESKEIKINLIYFQLLKVLFMIYSNCFLGASFVSAVACSPFEWESSLFNKVPGAK